MRKYLIVTIPAPGAGYTYKGVHTWLDNTEPLDRFMLMIVQKVVGWQTTYPFSARERRIESPKEMVMRGTYTDAQRAKALALALPCKHITVLDCVWDDFAFSPDAADDLLRIGRCPARPDWRGLLPPPAFHRNTDVCTVWRAYKAVKVAALGAIAAQTVPHSV